MLSKMPNTLQMLALSVTRCGSKRPLSKQLLLKQKAHVFFLIHIKTDRLDPMNNFIWWNLVPPIIGTFSNNRCSLQLTAEYQIQVGLQQVPGVINVRDGGKKDETSVKKECARPRVA